MNDEHKILLKAIIVGIVHSNLKENEWRWFLGQIDLLKIEPDRIGFSFAAINRKLRKGAIRLTPVEEEQINKLLLGFRIANWDLHRLVRMALLLSLKKQASNNYIALIERLFQHADMNEFIALYGSLIVLDYPEEWRLRCAEGVRSNMGAILEAIMYENPFPADYLDEQAWNQLVLKAFFTEKTLSRIVGLCERMNKRLASSLTDYAEERLSAGRTVDPWLWKLIANAIDEQHTTMLTKFFTRNLKCERQAIALALYEGKHSLYNRLLDKDPLLKSAIELGTLSWDSVLETTT